MLVFVGDGSDLACAGIWADSATYHTRDSLFLVLFNVISGIHHLRYWLCAFSKRTMCRCGCKGICTWNDIWRTVSWMFGVSQAGRYPEFRDDGVKFADSTRVGDKQRAKWAKNGRTTKVRTGCMQVRGDWAFHKQVNKLCGWRGEGKFKRCCFKCLANMTNFSFTEIGLDAAWRMTILSHIMFMQMCGAERSRVFTIPGVRVEHMTGDLMHTADLGTIQYLLGCIIWEVLFVDMQGTESSPDDVMSQFLTFIRMASKKLGMTAPPINRLTLGMIKKPGSPPKLKTKAAEGRRLLPCVLWVLENIIKVVTDHQRLRYNCAKQMQLMYESLMTQPFNGAECAKHGRKHLILWAELGRQSLASCSFHNRGWLLYRWYPKHHLLLHCLEDQVAVAGNPRECWCYYDESTIGEAVLLAESLHASSLHKSIMAKRRC